MQLGGGYLFGLAVGFVTDSLGSTLGATAAFMVGRTVSAFIIKHVIFSFIGNSASSNSPKVYLTHTPLGCKPCLDSNCQSEGCGILVSYCWSCFHHNCISTCIQVEKVFNCSEWFAGWQIICDLKAEGLSTIPSYCYCSSQVRFQGMPSLYLSLLLWSNMYTTSNNKCNNLYYSVSRVREIEIKIS